MLRSAQAERYRHALLNPRGLSSLGSHARHLQGLGPADRASFDGLAQSRQPVQIISQPLELVGAIVAEAQRLSGVKLQAGVAELPMQPAP